MTELHDVSNNVVENVEHAAIADGLRTLHRHDHLIDIHRRRIDNDFRASMLPSTQNQIGLDSSRPCKF